MSQFTRTKEDFTCSQCGTFVAGDGYTNHCPVCLWSRHVDVNPGDRLADCDGEMEPIRLTVKGHNQVITHRCVKCGYERNNHARDTDSRKALLILSTRVQ